MDLSLAISEYPCIEDVERNLTMSVAVGLASGSIGSLLIPGPDREALRPSSSTVPMTVRRIVRQLCVQDRPVSKVYQMSIKGLGGHGAQVVVVHKGTALSTVLGQGTGGCRKGFMHVDQ